jgi:hypothetical protein
LESRHPGIQMARYLNIIQGWDCQSKMAVVRHYPVQISIREIEGRIQGESVTLQDVDEGRKRVLLISASILAARKLAQYEPHVRVPATVSAIADAVRWAERIMDEIDHRWPGKATGRG